MKSILVPTDFSKYAKYAFELACLLAKNTGAEIHLYHCMDLPKDWENQSVDEKMSDRQESSVAIEARHNLIQLQEEAQAQEITCRFFTTAGNFLNDISEFIEAHPIDLIVMGSHGISGKEEWFIGSNTQKVVRKLKENILIVKEPVEELKFDKITFVSGLNSDDQIAFKSFLEFAKLIHPQEVHVLTIDTSAWFSQPTIVMEESLKDFENIASAYNCTTHFYRDFSIQSGIRHFVSENKIHLIGISNRIRNPLKRIFLGSNVEMLVNHSAAPVLSIGK